MLDIHAAPPKTVPPKSKKSPAKQKSHPAGTGFENLRKNINWNTITSKKKEKYTNKSRWEDARDKAYKALENKDKSKEMHDMWVKEQVLDKKMINFMKRKKYKTK